MHAHACSHMLKISSDDDEEEEDPRRRRDEKRARLTWLSEW